MPLKAKNRIWPLAVLLVMALVSCHRVPGHVIPPEKMARLMADIHTAEAVIDYNRTSYPTDSTRQALKQSIYARHGVTREQVDTSFVWYGHNLNKYMEVYDRTIAILDERVAETGNRISAEAALSMAGDSVDVWANPIFLEFSNRSPSNIVTYNLRRDNNWESGDSYTMRAKLLNNTAGIRWGIVAEYSDGAVEFINSNTTGDGWSELTFYTDSIRQARTIYGYIEVATEGVRPVWLDSISLVRNRLNPGRYPQRYRQRLIKGK